jgi:membrane associated rhomboid family serine protease
MGINDRDYAREEAPGLHIGGNWSGVSTLIVLNVVIFFFTVFAKGKWVDQFALEGDLFDQPKHFYQLFTYGWLHSQSSLLHIFGNMLTLWFFGPPIESRLGKSRFLQFYVSSIILAGLGWVLVQQSWFPLFGAQPNNGLASVIGASGAISAVLLLFAFWYPRQRVLVFGFPMPAIVLIGIYFLYDLFGATRHGDEVAHSAHLFGMAAGLLYWKTEWCLADLLPLKLFSRIGSWQKRRSSSLKIHRPIYVAEPDFTAAPLSDSDWNARLDAVLEKISTQGRGSLSAEEQKTLEIASRKLRARQGKE